MGIPASLAISNQINLHLNPIGMACAILVLLSITVLTIINRKLANRMTVRLIAAIAFTDLLAHFGEFYAVSNMTLKVGTLSCTAVNGFRLFGRTFYCFTNMAICFHLYRGLVKLKKSTWRFEIFTWLGTILMVGIVTVVYGVLGAFYGVSSRVRCTPGVDDKALNIVFVVLQGSVNVVTMVVCIITTIIGHRYLNNWINAYAESRSYQGENQTKFKNERRKMATRSFLYPLSTCITLPFEAIFLYMTAAGSPFALNLAIPMALGSGLAGILTAVAFSIDPATHKAFSAAYCQILGKRGSGGHQLINESMSETTSIIPLKQKV